jgi:4-amino-4-deoxy-L-arabinose transferase-like glycosyltransferase
VNASPGNAANGLAAHSPAAKDPWLYLGLAGLLIFVWLAILAQRPLFNPDEGRYAEIPREMLSGGDWIVPHLNGLDYIEKPPLQYWATALSYSLLGVSNFSARLYTALAALASVLTVWFLARRLWGRDAGWRAAAVLCGMLMFLVLGQLLTLDMGLTFWMTLSLAGFLLAQQPLLASRRWMLLAWAAAALGVLSKGLVAAAIPAAVLVIYSLAARDFAPWRRLQLAWGLPLFLALTVPWHWLAAHRLDDFLQFFFVHEHLARYLTPEADRGEPWWFFGCVFLAGTVPWTLSALRVVLGGWRRCAPGARPSTTATATATGNFDSAFFLWIWVMFTCVFFSLSDSKLMPYILPAMPALALLIGSLPTAALKRDFLFTAILTLLAGLALGVASFNWPAVVASSNRGAYFLSLAPAAREIAAMLAITGAFVLVRGVRDATRDTTRTAAFLGVGWCLAWLLLVRAAGLVAPIYSGVDLAAALPAAARDAPIFSVGTYDQSMTFYLQRTVTLVRYRGELDYGLNRAPEKEITNLDDFLPIWSSQAQAFAVMENSMFDALKMRGAPMRVIGNNVSKVLVARQ